MDGIYLKARAIDPVVEEYIKRVAIAKKYSIQTVRSAVLSLPERFGYNRMVHLPDCNGIKHVRI